MKKDSTKDWFSNIILFISIIIVLSGFLILAKFLYLLSFDYSIPSENGKKIMLEQSAQVGDYIGGLIGSLWALAGVFLFYLALRLQRKEFNLQRREFITNRITNLIYHQLDRIENTINKSTFIADTHISPRLLKGTTGIYALCEKLEFVAGFLKTEGVEININSELEIIGRNDEVLIETCDAILSSAKIINTVTNSDEIDTATQQELVFIFTENLGDKIKNLMDYIHKITSNYFYHKDKKHKEKYPLDDIEVSYINLRNLTKEILIEFDKIQKN